MGRMGSSLFWKGANGTRATGMRVGLLPAQFETFECRKFALVSDHSRRAVN